MAKNDQPLRGCFIPAIVLGAILLALGVLSALAIPRIHQRANEEWVRVEGILDEAYLKQAERESGQKNRNSYTGKVTGKAKEKIYSVGLRFHYRVDDREYAGDLSALEQPNDERDPKESVAIIKSFEPESAIQLFHHPTKHDQVRLTLKEASFELAQDYFFIVAYLLFGPLLIAFGFWARKTKLASKKA